MEKSYFFDSTADDQRIYQAADFARFHAQIIGNGVSNTASLPDLEVTAKNNMEVALGAGYMFANGYMYENDSTMTLTHDIADPNNDRIDRIVICFDNNPSERRIYAYIKKGTPATNPEPPELQRDNYVFEMSVAQVRIIAGQSFIEQSEITDERANDEVCGYIPLHNIYRGLNINQLGMVSMPNQSFLKAQNNTPLEITQEEIAIPIGEIKTDKQNEVLNDTTFKAKASGIYYFWIEIGWVEDASLEGADVQIYVEINGQDRFPLAAKVLASRKDNYLIQSGIDELIEGDEVEFKVVRQTDTPIPNTNFTRMRFAKLA